MKPFLGPFVQKGWILGTGKARNYDFVVGRTGTFGIKAMFGRHKVKFGKVNAGMDVLCTTNVLGT